MTNDTENTAAAGTPRELTASELDHVHGGTSHFVATLVATILNTMDPTANCTVTDNNKVACLK
jgi:hypothetical protein